MGVTVRMSDIRWNLDLKGEKKVQKGLTDTGDAAEKAGDQLEEMGDQATAAGKSSEKAGDKFKDTADDLGHVKREAEAAKAAYGKLLAEFNKTGDSSLLKDLGKEKRNLRKFENLAKDLVPDDAALGVGQQIMKGITSAAQAAGPAKIAIAGVGIAAAPLIGGAVAGAILGGVGAGGIVGGIMLAAQDPAVTDAARELAGSVSQAWAANGELFVQPTIDALGQLSTTGVKAAATLQPGMAALSGTVGDLADGIDGLVENALPGATQAAKAAAPVVRFLANELPELGQEFGDFLGKVSSDPDGAILALNTLLNVTEKALDGAGNLIAGFSAVYEWSARAAAEATGALEDIVGWVPLVGNIYSSTNDDLEQMLADLDRAKTTTDGLSTSTQRVTFHTFELGVAANDAADALNAQREAMSKLVDLELAAVSGTIAYERALDNLTDARKENGKSLDLDTEKGRSNTEAILASIEAVKENAEREYDLAIAHGATAQEAEEAAKKYRDTFGKELKDQIIRLFGNTDAVKALLAELDKLNGKKITYTIVQQGGKTIGYKVDGGTQLKGDEGYYHRASGGPFRKGPMYMVGENGPELVQFDGSGTVHNAVQTRSMMSGTSGGSMPTAGGGFYLAPAPNMPADMTALARLMIPYFQVVMPEFGASVEEAMGTPTR
jgi:hypothetical protein